MRATPSRKNNFLDAVITNNLRPNGKRESMSEIMHNLVIARFSGVCRARDQPMPRSFSVPPNLQGKSPRLGT